MIPDNDMQRCTLPRHFTAFALLTVVLAALTACAQSPVRTPTREPSSQPPAQLDLPLDSAAGRTSALLIAAEFALQSGNTPAAVRAYARAARLSRDPKVARRALDFALAAHDAAVASGLIQRWQALGAGPGQVAGARARLALLRGEGALATAQFNVMLAHGGAHAWKALGADLLGARDTALAGRVLEEVAKPARLPADEAIWVALSQLGEHLDRHAFARHLADAAVRRFDGAAGIRWAASLRLGAHDHAGALALYAAGVRSHPRDVDLRLGYAALLADDERYAEALKVLARGPQTRSTWAARVAYAAHAKDKAALRRLYAALQDTSASHRVDSAFLLGQLAELLERDREALRWYGEVDPAGAHAFEARVRTAVLLDKAGQHAEAHTLARELEQDYVDDPDSLRTAVELDAQLYSRHGEHAKAVAAYNRGLANLPDDPELLYDRGVEQATAGATDAALADFRRVLKLKPGDVAAMNALGFTLADADRDLPEATKLLKRALAAKPHEAAILDSWGWLQYRLGHFDKARQYLSRAWKQGSDPDVGVHLGEVLWKLGQHQDAREVFARVRKLDPHNAALRRAERGLGP